MPPHVPDFAIYLPGADSDQNDRRQQGVPFGVIHTTEGPDSRGIGQSRHHSTPGTFNFLNRDDGLYCFYPANVRTSHAAGGNNGVGIENEGHTGQPLTPNQIRNLGSLVTWLAFNYGIPLTYRTGDPRIWADQGYSGFIAHRAIAYPPNTSYQHHDEITPEEWAAAVGGSAPTVQTKAHDMVVLLPPYQNTVLAYVVVGNKMLRQLNSEPRNGVGIPVAAVDFATKNACPLVVVTQEEWDRVVTDDVGKIRAFLAKLFPAKAARAA